MKKRFLNYLVFAVSVFLLFVCVGCNNDVENNDGTGYVTFTEESSSRSLYTGGESAVDPENLVWAYVAVKKDGLHTVGASEVATSATAGKTELVDGKNYVLKPVKEDFSKGLNVEVGPFSWGEWKFVLYAYEKNVSGTFTNLVYTASTLEAFTTLNPLASGKTSVPVLLKFENGSGYPSTGTLKLGDISLIVPQGMKFYNGKTVEVSFTDTASPAIAEFTGTATLAADAEAGTEIPLSFTATEFANVAMGAHILNIEVKYDGTQITTAGAFTYTVLVKKGDIVTLYGDVTDLKTTSGTDTNTVFSTAVCKLGDVEYASLAEAIQAATSTNKTITLLRNVDYGGCVTSMVNTVLVLTGDYYIKNLTLPKFSGSLIMLELKSSSSATDYRRFGASSDDDGEVRINFFYTHSDGATVHSWFDGYGGYLLSTNTNENLYIYGRLSTLNVHAKKDVANNLGAHIYCDVYAGNLGIYTGYFEFGDDVHIDHLAYGTGFSDANTVMVGKPTTRIDTVPANTQVVKKVLLNGNGATTRSGAVQVMYAVKGTRVNLPKIEDTFNRTGWVCRWNTKADGTGNFVDDAGQTILVNDSVTLYAIWEMKCLCLTARTAGSTVKMLRDKNASFTVNVEYSVDEGETWSSFMSSSVAKNATGPTVTLANVGDKVYFRGVNTRFGNGGGTLYSYSDDGYLFQMTGSLSASGSIMSLLDGKGELKSLSGKDYAFRGLFRGCAALTSIPDLPATTLSKNCYNCMFIDCDGLTNLSGVYLPAEVGSDYCYSGMFQNCDNLTGAPRINLRTVGDWSCTNMFRSCVKLTNVQAAMLVDTIATGATSCFWAMFSGCTSLITPPSFYGVTRLVDSCFRETFNNCTKLTSIKVGFSVWDDVTNGTYVWVTGVSATGTFTCPVTLPTTTRDANHIPSGWTVVNGH